MLQQDSAHFSNLADRYNVWIDVNRGLLNFFEIAAMVPIGSMPHICNVGHRWDFSVLKQVKTRRQTPHKTWRK